MTRFGPRATIAGASCRSVIFAGSQRFSRASRAKVTSIAELVRGPPNPLTVRFVRRTVPSEGLTQIVPCDATSRPSDVRITRRSGRLLEVDLHGGHAVDGRHALAVERETRLAGGEQEEEHRRRLVEVPPRRTDVEAGALVGNAPRLDDVRRAGAKQRLQAILAIGDGLTVRRNDVAEADPPGLRPWS